MHNSKLATISKFWALRIRRMLDAMQRYEVILKHSRCSAQRLGWRCCWLGCCRAHKLARTFSICFGCTDRKDTCLYICGYKWLAKGTERWISVRKSFLPHSAHIEHVMPYTHREQQPAAEHTITTPILCGNIFRLISLLWLRPPKQT